ncbi:MAG: hypothetical protein GX591_08000 [Planctomycetes bacterium]|nr:hypothetical protein [Planctomycetota bacterium]
MKHETLHVWSVLAALAVAMAGGCAPARTPVNGNPSAAFAPDPTASQLQDLAGAMLLFFGAYDRLPTELDELQSATGLQDAQLVDPVTARPFLYDPTGLALASAGRMIVLLAAPAPGARVCYGLTVYRNSGGMHADVVTFPADAWATIRAAPDAPAQEP